ncbi:beta-ketoacyl synthase N-terminal-like domain-containing protein [Streptomyces sp. SCSIO 30461]|uniref:beta-ketoacyl synthase N-terminal-like domain-containing protein n=1 Tax=Streptomyces sp. SCSIO 30461 TaxID=3118085 RepID=UPI0030D325C8
MTDRDHDIAVIGMAGHFPQSDGVNSFWESCRTGADRISRWKETGNSSNRVPAGGLVTAPDLFDAEAFGVTPSEAELLDPQHRLFLEDCWTALEEAAVVPDEETLVSVYAAAAQSRYRPAPPCADDENGRYQQMIANAPDFLATRVAYLLDLRGEAVNVQTACSSSLVAVHMACQSLRAGQSDVALAGGVSVDPDQHLGYVHQEGMIASPDGYCRPFDARASGAVPGYGSAVVVLQRLGDALDQGRTVHAVIRATATNNDGRAKSGFMAPAVQGQAEVIASALAVADVPAETIGYLEAHGTGTRIGDPIELQAATEAFSLFTDRTGFCAVGSLKANFGHLDRAAGAAGLIKAVHAVREGVVPPLSHCDSPHPDIDLTDSPFRIPVETEEWRPPHPRRAGVSSFGVGGTNAHVIVEEHLPTDAERPVDEADIDRPLVLPLSAHGPRTLARWGEALDRRLHEAPASAARIAHTLAAGRRARPLRASVVLGGRYTEGSLDALPPVRTADPEPGGLALLFPGQGAEVAYAPEALMRRHPVFRTEIEQFADVLGCSTTTLLDGVGGRDPLVRAFAHQPSLAAVQVALARLGEHLGASAAVLCGSSIGEYAAAHLAGVFDHAGLMRVLTVREAAMAATPDGRMIGVACSASEAAELLLPGMEVAGDNAPGRTLVSGPAALADVQVRRFGESGVRARILPGRIAPHSALMEEAGERLARAVAEARPQEATRPVVSTLTGTWTTPGQLADPEHWARHLLRPIRFREAMETLLASGCRHFVEASPGQALTILAGRACDDPGRAVSLGGDPDTDAESALLSALGRLWTQGLPIDLDAANGTSAERFVSLPAYPFRRRRFWNHVPPRAAVPAAVGVPDDTGAGDVSAPMWRPAPLHVSDGSSLPGTVAVCGGGELATALAEALERRGVRVRQPGPVNTTALPDDVADVCVDLTATLPPSTVDLADEEGLRAWLRRGLLDPAAAWERSGASRVLAVTRGAFAVLPGEGADPAVAAVVGAVRCAPHERAGLSVRLTDLAPAGAEGTDPRTEAEFLAAELVSDGVRDSAHRGGVRYRRSYEPAAATGVSPFRDGGVYLVLGGTGRLGPVVAAAVAAEVRAHVVLAGRRPGRARSAHEERLLERARARGCTVTEQSLDASDPQALSGALDALVRQHGRVDGIFHLAAHTTIEDFPLLEDLDEDSAADVARAKVRAAAHLVTALEGRDYDFVMLFSSLSTVIGAVRFSAYVSANAYLDALAARTARDSGRPWVSLVWDGWTTDGRTVTDGLGSDDGAALLRRALRCSAPVLAATLRSPEERLDLVHADLEAVAEARAAGLRGQGSSAEETVARTIAEVTGHLAVDTEQSLTGLGIDSLQMMQIAARLRPVTDGTVSLGTLLAAGSVAELAALMEAHSAGADPTTVPAAPAVADHTLSTIQERLWYLAELDPSSPGYNVPFGWRLPPGTSAERARAAVLVLLERHPVLRTAYRAREDGRPGSVLLKAEDVPVEEVRTDPADPGGSFLTAARDVVGRPFDLGTGSTRVLLVRGEQTVDLVFVCHHMSVDAWSVRLIHDDIKEFLANGRAVAPPAAVYRDFVQWEQDQRAHPDHSPRLEYWQRTLEGTVATTPPDDPDVAPEGPGRGGVAVATRLLPRGTLDLLRAEARGRQATLYTAALTALSLALGWWTGESTIVIGTNLANRRRPDLEEVVGMFVDPVVLVLDPLGSDGPDATAGSVVSRIKESFTRAVAHAEVPFVDVVRAAGRDGAPLFSVIATMFDTDAGGTDRMASLDLPLPATAKFPLAVEFLPRGDGLLIHVLYDADRYRPASVQTMLDRVCHFLTSFAEHGAQAPVTDPAAGRTRPAGERFSRRFARAARATRAEGIDHPNGATP